MAFESILAPQFLIRNIGVISLIIAGFILVIFDDFANKTAFAFADSLRIKTARKISEYRRSGLMGVMSKYLSEGIATSVILLYVYFGTTVLANYVFAPILLSLKNIILPVLAVVFLIISYIVNVRSVRDRLRGLGG